MLNWFKKKKPSIEIIPDKSSEKKTLFFELDDFEKKFFVKNELSSLQKVFKNKDLGEGDSF